MPTLVALQTLFREMGIDPAHPGFYDQAAFLEAERRDHRFIKTYAQYIDVLPLDAQYWGIRSKVNAIPV